MGATANGQGWIPNPIEWTHEAEYKKSYGAMLETLEATVMGLAENDSNALSWLTNELTAIMTQAVSVAQLKREDIEN